MQGAFEDGLAKEKEVTDPGQASLIDYDGLEADEQQGVMDGSEEQKIKIFIDARERCGGILGVLRENAHVEIKQLEVGDYILSERVGVERKTVEDFLGSLIDKRLFTQAADLSRTFSVPVLIIEGREDIYSLRGVSPNAVRGAIASLAIDYGVSIIRSEDEEDTALFLYLMAKREQEEGREVSLRGERKPLLLDEQQRFVIESLPNVSAVLAKRLLERFGSVEGVVNASRKQLMEVEGIGEGKAEEIIKVIRNRYDKP
jgi:Fanconi anemia group M protein